MRYERGEERHFHFLRPFLKLFWWWVFWGERGVCWVLWFFCSWRYLIRPLNTDKSSSADTGYPQQLCKRKREYLICNKSGITFYWSVRHSERHGSGQPNVALKMSLLWARGWDTQPPKLSSNLDYYYDPVTTFINIFFYKKSLSITCHTYTQ